MTPKEKATELLVFFYGLISGIDEVEREFLKNNFEKLIKQMGSDTFYWSKAIDAALKCVDERIDENNSLLEYATTHMDDRAGLVVKGRMVWLIQVNHEILNYKSTIATTK